MRYITRVQVVDAEQYVRGQGVPTGARPDGDGFTVDTSDGPCAVWPGDWMIVDNSTSVSNIYRVMGDQEFRERYQRSDATAAGVTSWAVIGYQVLMQFKSVWAAVTGKQPW